MLCIYNFITDEAKMHEFSENKMKEFSQANQISKKSKDKSSSGNECLNQNKKVSFDFSNFNYR